MRKLTAGIFPDSAAARFISSPDDLDTHYARKYSIQWVGYKVHLTETCALEEEEATEEAQRPHLIVAVQTTVAPVPDVEVTARIQDDLAQHQLLPEDQLFGCIWRRFGGC